MVLSHFHLKEVISKISLVLFLMCMVKTNLRAQYAKFDWANSMGGTGIEFGYSIIADEWGNVYVTGSFTGTADFDPGAATLNLSASGPEDLFIQKFDATGKMIWAYSMGGLGHDRGHSIKVSNTGNVYITGQFEGTADFDPGPTVYNITSGGSEDIFLLNLDTAGNFKWVKKIGGTSYERGHAIALDSSDNVYVAGYFNGTVDFDPGPSLYNLSSNGYSDAFVLKLDSLGNFKWANSSGGVAPDYAQSVALDSMGNVFITGYFDITVDFDPGASVYNLTTNGQEDIFVQKLDSLGNFIWAKSVGGINDDQPTSIATDLSGNIYITGFFEDTVDFNPGSALNYLISPGNKDAFLQKLDNNGNYLWAKSVGGLADDYGMSVFTYLHGEVCLVGNYYDMADFDPDTLANIDTSMGVYDFFILMLDSSGKYIWSKSIGGTSEERGTAVCVDALGNLLVTGAYSTTVDFNAGPPIFNMTSAGSYDYFVLKLSPCSANIRIDSIIACEKYLWINGNEYTSSVSGVHYYTTNSSGCDSVVILDLVINHNSYDKDVHTACGPYVWIDSMTYFFSNDSSTFIIAGGAANGCDSIIELDLTITNVNVGVTEVEPGIYANAPGAIYQWLDCNNDYIAIPGETSQYFEPSVNGNYAVEITDNGCVDTSECITISTIGILLQSLNENLSIYPNPVSGILNINLGNLKNVTINVLAINGQSVYKKENINAPIYQFEFHEPPGIYIVELVSYDVDYQLIFVKN